MRRKGTYIHERPEWPQLTWDGDALAVLLAEVRHRQGRLLGKMEDLGFRPKAEANLTVLTNDVVNSSAIEGERLNVEEVRSSIASRLGIDVGGRPKVGRDVDGVVEMMLDATQNFKRKLTKQRLWRWHTWLFGGSRRKRITVGKWRPQAAGAMQVVSGALGKERVHFEAPGAKRLNAEMKAFLEWLNSPESIDPVLKAGVAHLWFVTIHPFEDGNGRIARAIADMALARADGMKERFYSMSSQIEAERKQYYTKLETAQRGDMDVTNWLQWFLECLGRAIGGAEQTLAAVLHKAELWQQINRRPVNERQRMVINRLLSGFKGNLTNAKYSKLVKCSSDTALRDIRELLDHGILRQNPGGGRSTSYRLAKPEEVAS